ncbi:hypothetical protein TUMEXPCC7403_18030 [Tumidithrix helvetica PCC 7403]|uniref:hypothetical protein n=1 Tax=Tumidithrix helvetica TaxID=3457545 RepID=UPI003C8130AA
MPQYKIEDRWGSKITPLEEIKLLRSISPRNSSLIFYANTPQSSVSTMYLKTHLNSLFHLFFPLIDGNFLSKEIIKLAKIKIANAQPIRRELLIRQNPKSQNFATINHRGAASRRPIAKRFLREQGIACG